MSNQPEREAWNTLLRWECAFEILSLDRAEPFLPEMGLHLSNVEAVRSLARKFIEELEALPVDTLEARTALLQEQCARIAEVTDQQTADHIEHWATVVVTLGNYSHNHFGWTWALWWFAGGSGRDRPSDMPNVTNEKLEAFAKAVRDAFEDGLELDNQIEQAKTLSKSSWDIKIYARSDESYTPFTTVSTSATEYRFRQAWKEIEKLLSTKEIDELVRWAKSHAVELQLSPGFLDRPRL